MDGNIDGRGFRRFGKRAIGALAFVIILSASVATYDVLRKSADGAHELYPVVRVVDGDTLIVRVADKTERVRLIGVDTPETVDPRKPVQCFGPEAARKTKELLEGRKVRLVFDPTQGERDKYRRVLAYVYRDDGLFVNLQLLREGFAHEDTYRVPYKFRDDFKKAEREASKDGKGLWAPYACAVM